MSERSGQVVRVRRSGRWRRAVRWGYLVPLASAHALRYRLLLPRRPLTDFSRELVPGATPRRRPSAALVARAVRLATTQGPLDTKCLVRSLVTARLLARFGYRAEVVIGVPDEPVRGDRWRAHAWVTTPEAGGDAMGFREIARLPR